MIEAQNPHAVAINPDRVSVDGAGNVLVAAHRNHPMPAYRPVN
jgi:hypothetical protein